jgi:hypothetical protein
MHALLWLLFVLCAPLFAEAPEPASIKNNLFSDYASDDHAEDMIIDESDTVDKYFRSHITSGGSHPHPWGLSYQRFPGALFSENFLLNSLNVGITKNLQVGTVPLMYLAKTHTYNINGKLVTHRARFSGQHRFYFGVGVSYFAFRVKHDPIEEKDGSKTTESTLSVYLYSLISTWVTSLEWLSFSGELSFPYLDSSSERVNEELNKNGLPLDFMFDTSLRYDPQFFHSFGVGWVRSHSFDALTTNRIFGLGTSFTWLPFEKRSFSISAGVHYFPETKKTHGLFGMTF